ncbi:glycosyltransferase family 2 protein [Streptococcus ictaluri]|uniref:Glycosyltransferase, group 2 family protein n=1 Tax=Streptococcus ictaluri 707-05 TaxID=764299 RepID=G5K3W2_9STRE|nr:glycosyltransferase family 2 protein [Streptococcus ictaluri]EHI69627.1 glycosyltransferase, group 2 family protein [Streptococcus ictaluri 707-05]
MEKVSVICTNYNKGPWLSEAIDSFLRQKTQFDFEIILIDDASTDHSKQVLEAYQKQFPDKIRLIFNLENLGITRTWVKACLEAKGQYIARCDGDDYWTDDYKLQKQVDSLEDNPDSKWSNTDFDFITSEGELVHAQAFKSGFTPLTDTYEKMLALKGMTMASTWLVDADLMRQVNQKINLDTSDDTFDIQLELFQMTRLTFVDASTTVYRMTSNSDSRPDSEDKMLSRIQGLLETQLCYLEKYPQVDYREIAKELLKQDAKNEIRIHQLSQQIYALHQQAMIQEEDYQKSIALLNEKINKQEKDIERITHDYHCVVHSRRWKYISMMIDFIRRKK